MPVDPLPGTSSLMSSAMPPYDIPFILRLGSAKYTGQPGRTARSIPAWVHSMHLISISQGCCLVPNPDYVRSTVHCTAHQHGMGNRLKTESGTDKLITPPRPRQSIVAPASLPLDGPEMGSVCGTSPMWRDDWGWSAGGIIGHDLNQCCGGLTED